MVKLFKLNNDKITIFHLEVQTAREAGDRGFQMSLERLYNGLEVALRVLVFQLHWKLCGLLCAATECSREDSFSKVEGC